MFKELFKTNKPLIGMVHLPPLPGAPGWAGDITGLETRVSSDVKALVDGGVHGLLFENFGDMPFTKSKVSPLTVSAMTKVILSCAEKVQVPFGINVLRNDWGAALAISAVTGASFIRINILTGAYVTDQGLIEGEGYACMRERRAIEHEVGRRILIIADADTKHGRPLVVQRLEDITRDLVERLGVDGVIVTGERTGGETKAADVALAAAAAGDVPVLVGSGVRPDNISKYTKYAQGFIVGTYLKTAGEIHEPVDVSRVREVVKTLSKI
ncbi:BtpA/SgcQ family protein [[Eubacterium] cellulosolvens]